jgi:hypothetical protein
MTLDIHQDDVWWQGIVLRKSPAGVFVYTPGVRGGHHSCGVCCMHSCCML